MKSLVSYILESNKKLIIGYVHGYGGSSKGHSYMDFKSLLDDNMKLIGIDFDENNPKQALTDIRKSVAEHHIDILLGTSYGGWLLMMLPEYKRVIANPCFHPQNELPRWEAQPGDTPAPEDALQQMQEVDKTVFPKCHTTQLKENLFCFFGDTDTFLGTKFVKEFQKDWYTGSNMEMIHSGHSIEKNTMPIILNKIKEMT